MKVNELLDGIRKADLVLPEFQREYVWSTDQAKQLMVSLSKDYPVGSFLFWKTDAPPELKNITNLPDKLGTIQVILDGQQRLTTLYLLITGEIPPYYTEADLETDPRDLYFNIDDGDFQYFLPAKMANNPVWIGVVRCFTDPNINVFEIAQTVATNGDDKTKIAFDLAQKFIGNLNRLRNIQLLDLTVQTVPSSAMLEAAIDIFDRVNSQGTKLNDAALALTHVTGKWSQARRVMKQKILDLEPTFFNFELSFLTRCLTGVVVHHALYEKIHDQPKAKLEDGWTKLSKILDYLVTILPQSAFIHSTQDLNTVNVLVPLVAYLSMNQNKFPNENSIKRSIHWLYAAQIWARYTSQTDQRLEFDVNLIEREPDPWDGLCNQIIEQRGRLEVKSSDLDGRWIQHPLYRMTYILCKAQGAVDWFNGAPLGKTVGKSYAIHNHHIFPQSRLYEFGYDPDNLMHRSNVNEIANRAFLTQETNLKISNRLPEDYFPEIEINYPGALAKQFIPMDTHLWRLDKYKDFLDARRTIIAMKINEYMAGLVTEPVVVHRRPILELIKLGESATLEFKSTLQWDVVQNIQNKSLRKQALKTIVAFLNSFGGTLVIGVEDDGSIFGLDKDLEITQNSTDKFANLLSTLVVEEIGPEFGMQVKIRFEVMDGHRVCVVDVSQSPALAFYKGEKGSECYIRLGPTSRLLDAEETVNYMNNKWR